jgi:hypothetical protein
MSRVQTGVRVGELELQGNRYATCVSSGETRRLGSMHGTRRLDVFRNYDHTLLVLESEGFASFTSRAILDSSESSDAAISSAPMEALTTRFSLITGDQRDGTIRTGHQSVDGDGWTRRLDLFQVVVWKGKGVPLVENMEEA